MMSKHADTVPHQNDDPTSKNNFDLEQWKQHKQQELEETFQQLNSATLGSVQDPDQFRSYLDLQAQLPGLSVSNALLVLTQRDQPIRELATYNEWKDRGRAVRRGENGFKTLASVTYTRANGSEGTSFKVSRLFDIAQTQGSEQVITPKQSIDRSTLIRAMVEQSPVEMIIQDSVDQAQGALYDPTKNKILVRNDLPDVQAVEVLAREMALATLNYLNSPGSGEGKAFISECTTYLISKYYEQENLSLNSEPIQPLAESKNPTEIRAVLNQIRQSFNLLRHRIDRGLNEAIQEAPKPARKHLEHER
ncbi:MAG: hypothetical protein EOM12_10970 [Verrucomicrobiae bacterium]|nr:hypothetical protein [Verrucomicrobiae bacterium]